MQWPQACNGEDSCNVPHRPYAFGDTDTDTQAQIDTHKDTHTQIDTQTHRHTHCIDSVTHLLVEPLLLECAVCELALDHQQGRHQVQVEGKALTHRSPGRRVFALLSVILADSSFTGLSRPEGAESEAPGGRGTFRVTDTTPECVLRIVTSFVHCLVRARRSGPNSGKHARRSGQRPWAVCDCLPSGLGSRRGRKLLLTIQTTAFSFFAPFMGVPTQTDRHRHAHRHPAHRTRRGRL